MEPITTAALIGGGAQVLGGLFGMSGQSSANRANERIAKENRDFQERMSSTAYQRAARDLEAAGLNRILAMGSPSSTPGGATAVMQNKNAPLAQGVSQAAHSALAIKKAGAEIENIGANTENTAANTELTRTRQLIASHGEVIAGITGDIVRALKTATGWDKLNNDQRAALITEKVNQARGFVTDALEKMGNTGKDLDNAWQRTQESMKSFVTDTLNAGREAVGIPQEQSDQKQRISKLRPEQLKIYNRQSRKYIDMGYLPWKARNMALDDATRAN